MEPTVGRKVWYRPSDPDVSDNAERRPHMEVFAGQPLDATIVAVLGARRVNLVVFDIFGIQHTRLQVTLVQEGDEVPKDRGYAEWMPYQLGQAKPAPAKKAKK